MDEKALQELSAEWTSLVEQQGCRQMALSLGPKEPECLYSVFLAMLVSLQRRLAKHGGRLIITDLTPHTRSIFEVCRLTEVFEFAPDLDAAVAALKA
jgi:hypothetical protein